MAAPGSYNAPSGKMYPHCYAFIQPAIQHRRYFYLALGMQVFALAICTTLTYHYSTGLVARELVGSFNPALYENVLHTGRVLPTVLAVVGFFTANCLTDRNFILYTASVLSGSEMPYTRELLPNAYWNELQAFAIPSLSLVLFTILFIQSSTHFRCGRKHGETDDMYERVASEFAHCTLPTVGELYDSRSETDRTSHLSTESGSSSHGKNGRLGCKKDVSGRLEELSRQGRIHPTPSNIPVMSAQMPKEEQLMAKKKLRKTDSLKVEAEAEITVSHDYDAVRRSPESVTHQ